MNNTLLKRSQARDDRAPDDLFREYGNRIYKSAIFLADSPEEAEDIVQETFLKAYKSIHGFKGQSSPYTWLYRILLNTCHDLRRKKYVRRKFLTLFKPDDLCHPIEDLIGQMDNDTFSRSLQNALASQKTKHREIIILRFFEDLKLSEIAARLNITVGTAKSRLHHALKKIKGSIKNIEHFVMINDQKHGGHDELR